MTAHNFSRRALIKRRSDVNEEKRLSRIVRDRTPCWKTHFDEMNRQRSQA